MGIKLEDGKRYTTRDGVVIGPVNEISPHNPGLYPFACPDGLTFTREGEYVGPKHPSAMDLIQEYVGEVQEVEEQGIKYDEDKLDWSLLRGGCPLALEGAILVLMHGAKKYSPDNWTRVPDRVKRYRNAIDRHLAAIDRGEEIDPESGYPHLDHALTNILFLSQMHHSK